MATGGHGAPGCSGSPPLSPTPRARSSPPGGGTARPCIWSTYPSDSACCVILVLGEAVGGAATGVHDAGWTAPSVAVGVAGFVIAAGLWWNYFDVTADHSESGAPRRSRSADRLGRGAPQQTNGTTCSCTGTCRSPAGIVIAGVGVEDLVLHPDALVALRQVAGPWACGLGLYLVGTALILGGTRRAWRAIWPWPTLALPIVAVAPLPRHEVALLLVGGLAAITTVLAALGTARRRGRRRSTSPT